MATQNGTKIEQSSFEQTKRPSKAEATIEARNFVFTNSYATMNTIHQQGQFEGFPTGQVEYYADTNSDDASLLMIRVDMSSSFNNIKAGSPLSLSIRTGDSPNAHAPEQMASSKMCSMAEFKAPSLRKKRSHSISSCIRMPLHGSPENQDGILPIGLSSCLKEYTTLEDLGTSILLALWQLTSTQKRLLFPQIPQSKTQSSRYYAMFYLFKIHQSSSGL